MPEHSTIQHADTHEPKHITTSLTSDAGKVITPSSSTAGTSSLRKLTRSELSDYVEHYGMQSISNNTTVFAVTAATDITLKTNGDYTQLTTVWDATPSGENNGITQGANGALTVAQTGIYKVEFWANTKSSINSTLIAFKFAVDGTITLVRRPTIFMRTSGEIHQGSAFGFVNLTANEVVTLHIASDKTADITVEDLVFSLTLMDAN